MVETERTIEKALNRAVAAYETASDPDSKEFYLLKTQILIFYYDVVIGMLSVGRNNASGFAKAVTLKSLVHSIYEYERQLNRVVIPKLIDYGSRRGLPIDGSAIRKEKNRWLLQFNKLKRWKAVRDAATGHYGQDIEQQIRELKLLNQKEVISVASAFTDYSLFVFSLVPHRKRSDM